MRALHTVSEWILSKIATLSLSPELWSNIQHQHHLCKDSQISFIWFQSGKATAYNQGATCTAQETGGESTLLQCKLYCNSMYINTALHHQYISTLDCNAMYNCTSTLRYTISIFQHLTVIQYVRMSKLQHYLIVQDVTPSCVTLHCWYGRDIYMEFHILDTQYMSPVQRSYTPQPFQNQDSSNISTV